MLAKATATQEYLLQMADGPSATDDDRYAAKLLATILGDDSGSRLYWELVDPGLAEHASLHHYEYMGAGVFLTYLSCDPECAADNLQRMLEIYREAETDGFTAAELEQAKNKINSRIVLGSERPRGRLFAVGTNWTHRRAYRSVADDLEAIDAVTLEQVAAVLARYPLTRSTSIAIGPLAQLTSAELIAGGEHCFCGLRITVAEFARIPTKRLEFWRSSYGFSTARRPTAHRAILGACRSMRTSARAADGALSGPGAGGRLPLHHA